MAEMLRFAEFWPLVRAGNGAARRALVRHYRADIVRAVRLAGAGAVPPVAVDPEYVCRTVFSGFFDRVVDGPYRVERSHDVRQLLTMMARNVVVDAARRQHLRAA